MHKTAVAALLAATTLVGPVYADDGKGPPSSTLEVFNSHGQFVGDVAGEALVAIELNGVEYTLPFAAEGLLAGIYSFLYPTANCTGTPWEFTQPGYTPLPLSGFYMNKPAPGVQPHTVWVIDRSAVPQTITVRSFWFENPPWAPNPGGASCGSTTFSQVDAVPLKVVDVAPGGFSPPFCVGTASQPCRGQ